MELRLHMSRVQVDEAVVDRVSVEVRRCEGNKMEE